MELGWKQGFRVSAREPVLPLGVETVEDVGKGSHESELEPHVVADGSIWRYWLAKPESLVKMSISAKRGHTNCSQYQSEVHSDSDDTLVLNTSSFACTGM